jgi:hypothetical protein
MSVPIDVQCTPRAARLLTKLHALIHDIVPILCNFLSTHNYVAADMQFVVEYNFRI